MKQNRSYLWTIVSSIVALTVSITAPALAQEAPAVEATAVATAEAKAAEAAAAEGEAAAKAAAESAKAAEAALAETKAIAEAAPSDGVTVDWSVMASGNYLLNALGAVGFTSNVSLHPYTNSQGFNLNFAGGGIAVSGKKFGSVFELRAGQGAQLLTPLSTPYFGVKQAYVSYKPLESLSFDLGFFDTVYGAEVADEWNNVNYSRGALYFNRQPFNHMGLRVGYQVSDELKLNFLVVNGGVLGGGVNASAPTPLLVPVVASAPAFGWQAAISAVKNVNLVIGGIHAPNGLDPSNRNRNWEHLIDVVASVSIDNLAIIFNGDLQIDPNFGAADAALGYGLSLAAMYALNPEWAVGARGEYLGGNSVYAFAKTKLIKHATGTLTLRYSPVEYLNLSLEPRLEYAEAAPFNTKTPGNTTDLFYGVIFGASVHYGRSN